MDTIKSVAAPKKKRTLARSQEEYVPLDVKDARSATKAFYHLFMSHNIDFCELMLDVISEKYEISRSEILDVVMTDPRITKMLRHPILDSLGYFTEDELVKSFEKLSTDDKKVPDQKTTIRIKKPKPQTSSAESNVPEPLQSGHLPSQGAPQ